MSLLPNTHTTHTQHTHTRTHTHNTHTQHTHTRSIYVFIKAMFSFIFTSLTAVHIYDFHIIKKHRKKNKEEKQRERRFSLFPL